MSEEMKGSAPKGIDPFAASLAMSGASREKADAFLDDQRHHIHEQLKQIHLDIFEKWLGVFLRLATLCVGIAAAGGVGLMVWDAAHSNGLLIEPFSVPPDMAEKGLTGQVIASQVQDRLTAMQALTQSFRPARSYTNNWGNDIKVEIPETGVSIGEFRRFLRDWLGHNMHISCEVWHTDTGLAISARTSGDRGATFAGPASAMDDLVQQAAEHVFGQTQPYRYANYLRGKRRLDEARAIFLRLTQSGSPEEQGWAWQGISTIPPPTGGSDIASAQALRKAIAIYPEYTLAHVSLAASEAAVGHSEQALAQTRVVTSLLSRSSIPDVDPPYLGTARTSWPMRGFFLSGDFAQSVALGRTGLDVPDQAGQRESLWQAIPLALAKQHDAKAAQDFLHEIPPSAAGAPPTSVARRAVSRFQVEVASENWANVLALRSATEQIVIEIGKKQVAGPAFDGKDTLQNIVYPGVALAMAKLGDDAGAKALIAATPADCFDCVRVRGMIEWEAGRWASADSWFSKAVHDGPSLPFAYTDWGISLLARGQADAAIEKFKLANEKGPHFADALEGWGEALMAKNQSHRTLEKFAEAEKYAPNWGRLHLKWGEALVFAGKKAEGRAQLAKAQPLDLTPSEKMEMEDFLTKHI